MDLCWLFRRRISRPTGAWRRRPAKSGGSTVRWSFGECAGDDLDVKTGVAFPRPMKVKRGETVMFSWITFKSRAHRDRVNAKVMKDPRLAPMMDPKAMPFDAKRMAYGGFKVIVNG